MAKPFITARESPLFLRAFTPAVKWLFNIHFKQVWLHQQYQPAGDSRTIYYLNHTMWWDGLIPLMLNAYRFKQQARAMMIHEQMLNYPFFKYAGVFSVDPEDRSHLLASMRYALQSMQRHHCALFIYPEGEIRPADGRIPFLRGLHWLHSQLPNVDVVPIGIHMQAVRQARPELHIWVGDAVKTANGEAHFRAPLQTILDQLLNTAGFDDSPYEPFL